MKRKLIILVMLCLLIVALAVSVSAADESDLTFVLNSDGNSYSVSSCNSSASGDLVIPATYNGKPVTSIGDNAICDQGRLTSVNIPDSVASIGNNAFSCCYNLASMTIPDSVTSIGDNAFSCCYDLVSVTIGVSVTSIGDYAFDSCDSLTSMTIPDSVTNIGDNAFRDCSSLTSVTIGNGVTTIGDYAFYNCDSLTSVTIGDGVTNIGEYAFEGCESLTSIIIPKSVTRIGYEAFRGSLHKSFGGTRAQWNKITIGNSAEEVYISHYQVENDPVAWKKNCENEGNFCSLCNDFVSRENAQNGAHTYTDKTDLSCNDCDFVQHARNIGIQTVPTKTKYYLNDRLDVTGGKVKVYYDDGADPQIIDMTAEMVSGFNNAKLGASKLTVTYQGKTATYKVQVDAVCSGKANSDEYPQSSHNYASNTDETKTYTADGAYALVLTFSADTATEGSDYIYLYDGQDNEIAKYSGTQAAGVTVTVYGDTFKVRLVSDDAINKYGYSFDSIVVKNVKHKEAGGKCSACGVPLNGLVKVDGVWGYYKNGVLQTSYTGLVKHSGVWYYVQKGKVNFDYTGLAKYSGTYYYVKNGKKDATFTGVCKNGSVTYYVQKGTLKWGVNGLVKCSNGDWYYVNDSRVQNTFTGLVKYGSTYYYVNKGKMDKTYTGVVAKGSVTYFVQKGILKWGKNGLVKCSNGDWYYVKDSRVQSTFTGLVKHSGAWYYVQKGKINFSYTGLVKHSGTWYYVQKGKVNFNYTGNVVYNGKTYKVVKGRKQ